MSVFPKIIVDTFDDLAEVDLGVRPDRVYLAIKTGGHGNGQLSLTPFDALRLANALIEAASTQISASTPEKGAAHEINAATGRALDVFATADGLVRQSDETDAALRQRIFVARRKYRIKP